MTLKVQLSYRKLLEPLRTVELDMCTLDSGQGNGEETLKENHNLFRVFDAMHLEIFRFSAHKFKKLFFVY